MNLRKLIFIVVALIVLLGGSYALSMLFISMKPEPPRRPDVDIKRYVKAQTVEYSTVISSVIGFGNVVSGSELMLVSEASGKIEKGNVVLKKGTSFKKGQVIAEIYKDEVELALQARKSRFLNTFTNILPDIKIDYPDQYQLFLSFFNSVDLKKELPELPSYTNEKLKIFLASRNILSEFYGIRQDEKRLSRHTLVAPFDGAFTQVNFEVGAYVNTGAQIARMIRTNLLEVEVPVTVTLSKWIKIGDKVKVISEDKTESYNAKVVRKSAFVEASTQSRSIFVEINPNSRNKLMTGESYFVEFSGQKIDSAMEIPRSAVFNTSFVYTVKDGRLKKEQINIIKTNEKTIIFDGLEANTELVIEPLINVKDGLAVEIIR